MSTKSHDTGEKDKSGDYRMTRDSDAITTSGEKGTANAWREERIWIWLQGSLELKWEIKAD